MNNYFKFKIDSNLQKKKMVQKKNSIKKGVKQAWKLISELKKEMIGSKTLTQSHILTKIQLNKFKIESQKLNNQGIKKGNY